MHDRQSSSAYDTSVDLNSCDREPIHLLGNVQAYGCLVSTSADWIVNHVSENVDKLLGLDGESMIGCRFNDILPQTTLTDLRREMLSLLRDQSVGRLFAVDVMGDGRMFDISIHISDRSYIFEFEPRRDKTARNEMSAVQALLLRIKQHTDLMAICQEATWAVRQLSGFDRVMVYRFGEDGSGEVIAETRQSGMEPMLGLRYPASDIPAQARALYTRSLLRLIADVDGDVSRIVPAVSPEGAPLDLSLSVTRAVSPTHLEYLRNMGVSASMSVSILRDGVLWGLIACHHRTPRYVDYERRSAIELLVQFFSYELFSKASQIARREDITARTLHERLMVRLSSGEDIHDGFEMIAEELSEIISNDGVAVFSEGRFTALGATPTREEFLGLVRFLNTTATSTVYTCDALGAVYHDAEYFADRVAGLMAVPISRMPRDYIVFFRREVVHSVQWAGNPRKSVETGRNGVRLTPRKSFAAWREIVRGSCMPWTDREKRAGKALRISLIEVVLKLTDEANVERQRAAEKQELLISELNHRVRNILNLIQGLVSQSRGEKRTIEAYTKVLGGRIQVLARAHDQLTRTEWAPVSMRDLIIVEIRALLHDYAGRVRILGDDAALIPEAFSTLALVIHELITNSAKYGALAEEAGSLDISLMVHDDGSLEIQWKERDGPPIQAPIRHGFGTMIIEKTIPFALKGVANIHYRVTGLEANFMIPPRYVRSVDDLANDVGDIAQVESPSCLSIDGGVLIVEDNLIIAMDASDMLRHSGAPVFHIASCTSDALDILEVEPITIALLDVNLGVETSALVAEKLEDLDIPFILATGYGENEAITTAFPPAPVLQKPYSRKNLISVIHALLGD